MKFIQDPLSYKFDALEPHLDAATMELHYGKHHAAYVAKLNTALEGLDIPDMPLEKLLQNIGSLPEDRRKAVNNNGFQHFNHAFYWKIMTPGGSKEPVGKLAEALKSSFGSTEEFTKRFSESATTHFGSGWTWLYENSKKELVIESLPNEGSPVKTPGNFPILCLDLWEHAYYLKYQNRRPEFIENWWKIVNWNIAEALYPENKSRS
jgi:Fe-Mn family superoxide dismutase